jgi:hypothetical protein
MALGYESNGLMARTRVPEAEMRRLAACKLLTPYDNGPAEQMAAVAGGEDSAHGGGATRNQADGRRAPLLAWLRAGVWGGGPGRTARLRGPGPPWVGVRGC